ncbi:hypothetical protein LSCM1_02279 [Leishmania martiniquensis]|uniref:Uncharacterized protein n=1 Tax=Leishmania martiniquensis TaxID=1580590 RepID=A0A836GMI8_9TRYP|nr:hypothetical protein LSCM1_02279 [Leishmania martiniquensis]
MTLTSPSRSPMREPSLRVREPSIANADHKKASIHRDFCTRGQAAEETEALEPVESISATVSEEFVRADSTSASMMKAPLVRVQCTPHPAAGQENALGTPAYMASNQKSARSPHPPQLMGSRLPTDEAVVSISVHADGARQTCANASCGTRGSAANSIDRSLTEIALSTVLRPSRDNRCESERLSVFSAAADSDVAMDDVPPTVFSFEHTQEGTHWCAVVAAHTEAVHRLATKDITSECGITTAELLNLTLIATEATGLQIRFQLATWGDTQREVTLRRQLTACAFRRLTELYQHFVKTLGLRLLNDEDGMSLASSRLAGDNPPALRVWAATANNHRSGSEDRRQLIAEFESTLDDMRSIQIQKEKQILHVTSQLEEERLSNAQHVADLQSQLDTMRLDYAYLCCELESVSAALLSTENSCNSLRGLLTESEQRHMDERALATSRYDALEYAYNTLQGHNSSHNKTPSDPRTHKKTPSADHTTVSVLATTVSDAVAALEAKSAASESEMAAARDALEAPQLSEVPLEDEGSVCSVSLFTQIVVVLRKELDKRAKKLVCSNMPLVSARRSVEEARRNLADGLEGHDALDAALDPRGSNLKQCMEAAERELRAAKERYLDADAAACFEEEENPLEEMISELSLELIRVREKLKTMRQLNRMLREKFRSDLQASQACSHASA